MMAKEPRVSRIECLRSEHHYRKDHLLFVRSAALTETLSRSTSRNLRFQPAAFSGFQIERVLLGIGDDSFAGYLPFKASYRAFNTLVIVNLYLCHSRPPLNYSTE